MVPLSARTPDALVESARRTRETLDAQPVDLYALAGNLSRRRTHFATRTAFAVRDREELAEALDAFAEEEAPMGTAEEGERRLLMVFAGQGTQWAGCGRDLYEAHPVFRRAIDAIDDHWRAYSGPRCARPVSRPLRRRLDECELAQPVIFAIQCALVELFKTWGVYPDSVLGHSSGEVAAAYASGALSLADATRLVFHRATLQQRVAGSGRMLTIGLDRPGVEELLDGLGVAFRLYDDRPVEVEIACENAPANTVICGPEDDLQPVMEELDRRKLQNRLIPGKIAFHSRAMDAIEDDALEAFAFLDDISFDADVPFLSSVTGARTERLDSVYWWSNIRQAVRFAAAMETAKRDHRPDVVLELAPHSALQPIIAQCVEDATSGPVSVPTLMRDTDTCLGFHEALGNLFKAGVSLDFAAQYPAPTPSSICCRATRREERKSVDNTLDDEFLQKRSEYSHGPLVGHRVPCDHPLLEARLSEAAFPWLAEHRVHHAPIMPAAGFIELVLEALEGAPAHIETLEFLQPCLIPKVPVRLQTALQPVPQFAGRIYRRDLVATLRAGCEVRAALPRAGPPRRARTTHRTCPDTCRRSTRPVTSHCPMRRTMSSTNVLRPFSAKTFQYGPHFRNMRQLRRDVGTDHLMFDVEVDEALWRGGQREGYVMLPALLDGGLQSYLYDLMLGADLFAIPRRAENVTFLRPPTVPRMTCRVTYPDNIRYEVDDKGPIFGADRRVGLGQPRLLRRRDRRSRPAHRKIHLLYLEPETGRPAAQQASHRLAAQVPHRRPGNRGPAARRRDRAIRPARRPRAGGRCRRRPARLPRAGVRGIPGTPEQTVLQSCVEHLSREETQSEFWLIADDEEGARAHLRRLPRPRRGAALRLSRSRRRGRRPRSIRACCAGTRRKSCSSTGARMRSRRTIGGSGGTRRSRAAWRSFPTKKDAAVEAGAGWTALRVGRRATLLQAPVQYVAEPDETPLPGPRWVMGEPASLAGAWISRLDDAEVHAIPSDALASGDPLEPETYPDAADVQAIDFFCDSDPEDSTGERAVSQFVALMQSLVPYRIERANCRCRVTVATRKAAFEAEDARGSALWGAVRSMAIEVGEEAGLDFRLVDLGTADDLETLAWLARHDLRERELAVREGQLWVPRVLSDRDEYPRVAPGEDPSYRLFLDNAGQIGGLRMKTYEPPPLGPHHVEIDVAAAALNFRDVMVTLGLLPALAYERSALGREVGMEASGVVRRAGMAVDGARTRR